MPRTLTWKFKSKFRRWNIFWHRWTNRQIGTTSISHIYLMLLMHQLLNLVHSVLEAKADFPNCQKLPLSRSSSVNKQHSVKRLYCVSRSKWGKGNVSFTQYVAAKRSGAFEWGQCSRQSWRNIDTRGNFIRMDHEDCNFCNCTKLVIWQSNRGPSLR